MVGCLIYCVLIGCLETLKYDSEVVSYQLMSLTSWGICPINQMVSIMAQVIIISLLFTLKIKKILKELQTAIRILGLTSLTGQPP